MKQCQLEEIYLMIDGTQRRWIFGRWDLEWTVSEKHWFTTLPPASYRTIELCIPFTAKVAESTSPYKGFDTLCLTAPHHTDALRIPLSLWCPAMDSCYRPLPSTTPAPPSQPGHPSHPDTPCLVALLNGPTAHLLRLPISLTLPTLPPTHAPKPTLLSPTYRYANF